MRVWRSECGLMELREGSCFDVLRDARGVHAVISDPPYSVRQHGGYRSGTEMKEKMLERKRRRAGSTAKPITGGAASIGVPYAPIDRAWCFNASALADRMGAGWLVAFGDHVSQRWWELGAEGTGWLTFAPLGWVKSDGGTPRFQGDGPGCGIEWITVARRRGHVYPGSLPPYYMHPQMQGNAHGKILKGQKPLGLMRAIVRDYSEPGSTIVDFCAGSGTTLLAAAVEGRRAIGSEIDPKTFDKAVARLSKPYTRSDIFRPTAMDGSQATLGF